MMAHPQESFSDLISEALPHDLITGLQQENERLRRDVRDLQFILAVLLRRLGNDVLVTEGEQVREDATLVRVPDRNGYRLVLRERAPWRQIRSEGGCRWHDGGMGGQRDVSGNERDGAGWLRAEVEGDLGVARHILDKRGARPDSRLEMHDAIADAEAKLAIIGLCEPLLPPDPADLAEDYQDGRDSGEIMRDEALADLAGDVLALLADGYKHRPGWAGNWASRA
jgi:hypothetical protein